MYEEAVGDCSSILSFIREFIQPPKYCSEGIITRNKKGIIIYLISLTT